MGIDEQICEAAEQFNPPMAGGGVDATPTGFYNFSREWKSGFAK